MLLLAVALTSNEKAEAVARTLIPTVYLLGTVLVFANPRAVEPGKKLQGVKNEPRRLR